MVEQRANVAILFSSYFDYVMLTYERYQALHAIQIRVPGEPGNEAIGWEYGRDVRRTHHVLKGVCVLIK